MFTLEKLCLDLIVQKFERFHFAFTISKGKNQQRNFEFLQRRYSGKLAIQLHAVKRLKEEYFEILVNKHLDIFYGEWFRESRYLNSNADTFRRLPNLTRICFRMCDDEILKNVATFCPKIVEIDVSYSHVTDKGVNYLCETKNGTVPCPKIKVIFIEYTHVTDRGAECLIRNLPLLERIDYANIPQLLHSIYEKELRETGKIKIYNLVELTLEGDSLPNYTTVLGTCLKVCPKLESLICYISDAMQLNIPISTYLKKLHLMSCLTDADITINNLLKLNGSNLTCLKIGLCTMSISLLGAHCPVLKEFSANHVRFTDGDNDDDANSNFAVLTKCRFRTIDPSYQKAICLLFSSSPTLESVSFKNCRLSLELKTQILNWCKIPSPKKIIFKDFYLEDEKEFLMDILLNGPYLNELSVSRCSFNRISKFEEAKETLRNLCKTLSHKPKFVIY